MKKSRFLLGTFLVLTLLSFTSCSREKPADQIIKEGVQNLGKATSYAYEGKINVSFKQEAEPKDVISISILPETWIIKMLRIRN